MMAIIIIVLITKILFWKIYFSFSIKIKNLLENKLKISTILKLKKKKFFILTKSLTKYKIIFMRYFIYQHVIHFLQILKKNWEVK
jgi:hypothetical protein